MSGSTNWGHWTARVVEPVGRPSFGVGLAPRHEVSRRMGKRGVWRAFAGCLLADVRLFMVRRWHSSPRNDGSRMLDAEGGRERVARTFERVDDALDIVHAPAPCAAADLLQGGPKPRRGGEVFVGSQLGVG